MIALAPAATLLRRAAARALDLVLPPRCLACDAAVDTPGALCPECWAAVEFIGPPLCAVCGLPFEYDPGAGALCAACAVERPIYERARAVLRYGPGSRELVLRFKHGDRTDAAPALGRWLARAGAELVAEADLVVPVPLHWSRLLKRRYNQSALLAQALARAAARPSAPDLLLRRRRTPSQGEFTAAGRRRNVAGAFRVRPDAAPRLAGRRLLLIDDVLTTGATVAECSRVLLAAGAAAVDVLTLARAVRPQRVA